MSNDLNNKAWVVQNTKQTQYKQKTKSLNRIVWLLVCILVALGVVASYMLSANDYPSSIVTVCIIISVLIVLFVAKFTNQGNKAWIFFNGSRLEMRKVVWPTRQETITSTLIVLAIVVVASLVIYFVGLLFMSIISAILG